jgi:hypothetical protein
MLPLRNGSRIAMAGIVKSEPRWGAFRVQLLRRSDSVAVSADADRFSYGRALLTGRQVLCDSIPAHSWLPRSLPGTTGGLALFPSLFLLPLVCAINCQLGKNSSPVKYIILLSHHPQEWGS